MEAGLMEIVRSLNRNWIYDTYFSLYRAIHPGRKVRGKCPGECPGEMSGYRSIWQWDIYIPHSQMTSPSRNRNIFVVILTQWSNSAGSRRILSLI